MIIALLIVCMLFYLFVVVPLLVRFLDRMVFGIRTWTWFEAWMLYFKDIGEKAHDARRSR